MKKKFKLLSASLMALALTVPAQALTLTVCDSTNTSNYVPFRNIDVQDTGTHSQFIYPADMVADMNGQQINSVVFYLNGGLMAKDGQIVVSMGETDNATYSTARDFREGLSQVATFSMTEGVTELVVDFDTPYTYAGGNLVMDFYVAEGGDDNYYGWNAFYGKNTSNYAAIGTNGSMATFLPKATFDYGVPAEWGAKVAPAEVTFKTIRAEREDVQTIVLRNTGLNAFTPVFGALEAPFSVEAQAVELAGAATMEIPVKFAPMAEGEYSATLTIDCGQAGILEVALNGTALEAANEVTVCDNTTTNKYIPTYGLYFDDTATNAQMIYPADKLTDLVGKEITGLTFYAEAATGLKNGTFQLSMMMTDQTEFTTAEMMTGMTVVATLTPDPESNMLTFTLDTPFLYTGGNLAIENNVIVAGNYKSNNFYGESVAYNASAYAYNNWGVEIYPESFLPKATFLYKDGGDTPEPQVMRGDVNGDENVNIADVTALIDYLLSGNEEGIVLANTDSNGDNATNIADVTALIDYLLSGAWAE